MIDPGKFYQQLQAHGIRFFTGVPDSLFKDFLLYLQDNVPEDQHFIAANEAHAIALAAGYYLSSGKLPLVYMQNSGLGNAINPLTSLADKEVYGIPLLLMIGWRGRPGVKDEPQHIKMGRITEGLLDLLEIPRFLLGDDEAVVEQAVQLALKEQRPVALLISEHTFEVYNQNNLSAIKQPLSAGYSLSRKQVLQQLLENCSGEEIVVCTTGKSGRELYELNKQVSKTFLSVGAMGLANQVALGINLQKKDKMIMIDGDGAVLMQLGTLPAIARWASDSFVHVVINNGAHESVGGQPTLAMEIDLCGIASASGYEEVIRITSQEQLSAWLKHTFNRPKKQFVEIRVNRQSGASLMRPSETPAARKQALMNLLLNTNEPAVNHSGEKPA